VRLSRHRCSSWKGDVAGHASRVPTLCACESGLSLQDVAEAAHVPVFASGGVSSANDLRALQDRGVAGAIVGMALYTGALDPRAVIEEFHEE